MIRPLPLRRAPILLLALIVTATGGCVSTSGVATRYPGRSTDGSAPVPVIETAPPIVSTAPPPPANATPQQLADDRMRVAESAYLAGNAPLADDVLDQVPVDALDADRTVRYRLLRAEIALARHEPRRALSLLPTGDPGGDPALASGQLDCRAHALDQVGDVIGALQARVTRDRYLSGASRAANDDALWGALRNASLDSDAQARAAMAAPEVRGWVDLALLAQRGAAPSEYQAWREHYPDHPGAARIDTLIATTPAGGAAPMPQLPPLAPSSPGGSGNAPLLGPTALLLPASGTLGPFGNALREGFLSAAGASATGVQSYDTAGQVLPSLARSAIANGATVLVGPLLKDTAAQLAASGVPTRPVLALNYLDAGQPAPPDFWQFGLAPEDEARAVAEDAVARGLPRALALVPSGDWGDRVLAAFIQRMQALGGRVVDVGHYSGQPENWSDPVKTLLHYVRIDDKRKAAELRAKAPPGVDPQRRNDFDFVFVAGRSAQARVLWPLLRYYHADRIPTYATAAAYEGDGDNDLAGLRFCDSPWVIDTSGTWSQLHDAALTGRGLERARFYALGVDAETLAARIASHNLHPGDVIAGATGRLEVDAGGVIHRRLGCAQMTVGSPFPLQPPDTAPTPLP